MILARLSLAFTILISATCSFAEDYVFNRFDTEVDIQPNSDLVVREYLEVTFSAAKHGIFRTIPVRYDTGRGVGRNIYFRLASVNDENGRPHQTKLTYQGNNVNIRIGDPDVVVTPGTKVTYVISYNISGAINWFEKETDWDASAELYWNLTGTENPTVIEHASFKVTFPKAPLEKVRAKFFSGAYGSKDADKISTKTADSFGQNTLTRFTVTDTSISGDVQRPLAPYEGITIVVGLPSDIIKKPSWDTALVRFLKSNIGFFLPLPVLLIMWLLWSKYGKDPYGGPMVVQYDPPDDISGSEAGALIDERVDQRDIVAGIITLAVKGYLKISVSESKVLMFTNRETSLIMTGKQETGELGPFESKLLGLLSGREVHDEADLRSTLGMRLQELRGALYAQLVARGYYLSSPESTKAGWGCAGIAIVVLCAFIIAKTDPFGNSLPAIVGGVLAAIIVGLFANAMPQRTKIGARARSNAQGFHEFISRARGQELKWMEKKHPDMMLFEAYLPHAIAFGLGDVWAQAFAGVLTEPPNWYVGPHGYPFTYGSFMHDLNRTTSDISSAATPPRSSGASGGHSGFGGGGGFSGGGFGGGGSGSW